ncbi:hypothetical protein FBR02_06740 [Anaerolineae bacterium CFX9]|nr:hypothetical protein [Chloroflexota bacterium]MDL1900450.1 hypothetical protein [Anaerolineae bacterium CFX9]
MGYDCYAILQAQIPNAAIGQAVLDVLEADENWGVFPVSEVGDDHLYFQWEGRNRDEESVYALLEPVALRHAITFEVEYSSDYDSGLRFFVGVDAQRLNTLHQLDQVMDALQNLLSPPQQRIAVLKAWPRRVDLETLLNALHQLLAEAGETSS